MSRLWKALALAVTAFLVAAAAYRAATLSITVDEAYTYTQFASRPLGAAVAEYDANNHVLYTLLAKAATGLLGAGDFTLRLPALAGAALFYAALYRLMLRLAGGTWWLPLGVALTGGNTYVTDLLPLARGYGLGVALFTLGLTLLLDEVPRPRAAGVALGLAVAANLTFLFPIAGLLAGLLWLDRRQAVAPAAWATGVALAFLAAPFWHASRENFYYGVDSLAVSALSLMGVSLERNRGESSVAVLAGMVLMAATFASTIATARGARRPLFLLASSIAGGLALLVAGHYATGLLYPYGRTGISWLLLFGVSSVALASRFRTVKIAATPIALAALYCYARVWSTASTVEWDFDAGTRAIVERIAAEPRSRSTVRVAASGAIPHTINYYRVTRGWTWLEDVKLGNVRQGRYDYYVLTGEDREWAGSQRMTVLYEHPAAHSILARR